MTGLGSYSVSIITSDGERIHFDGGLLFNDLQGINPTELRMASYPAPLRDLTYINYHTYAPRKITAVARLMSKRRCSIWVLRQELIHALNPLRGPFTLCFELEDRNVVFKMKDVILGDALDSVVTAAGDPYYAEFPISLTANDPTLHGLSHTTSYTQNAGVMAELFFPITFDVGASPGTIWFNPAGFTIDWTDTVVVNGNWRAKPTIIFTGPMKRARVQSMFNTDLLIQLQENVPTGRVVTVDTRLGKVYNDLGVDLPLTKNSRMNSFFFTPSILAPTGVNAVWVYAEQCEVGGSSKIEIVVDDTYYAV
jgi:hypothetical protein